MCHELKGQGNPSSESTRGDGSCWKPDALSRPGRKYQVSIQIHMPVAVAERWPLVFISPHHTRPLFNPKSANITFTQRQACRCMVTTCTWQGILAWQDNRLSICPLTAHLLVEDHDEGPVPNYSNPRATASLLLPKRPPEPSSTAELKLPPKRADGLKSDSTASSPSPPLRPFRS